MKKITLLTCGFLFSLSAFQARAQLQLAATIGPQFPVGDFGKAFKTGFGFTATGRYLLADHIAIGLNLGYNSFGVKDLDGYKASLVPVTALFEYHLTFGKIKPYAGLDMGVYRFAIRVKSGGVKQTTAETDFGIAPAIGADYALTQKLALNASLKFNHVFTSDDDLSYVGLNVGAVYSFR